METEQASRATAPEVLLGAIHAMVRRFSISERADVSCCGMTVAQAATLHTLALEGPMRLGALGSRLGISPSTLSRNALRLEERELIERLADPEDRRASVVRLTHAGRQAASKVGRRERDFASAILERLPAERREAVLDDLLLLLDAIRDATESCCPGAFDHLFDTLPDRIDRRSRS